MEEAKCKICRRLGVKLFLVGDRCFTQKCAIVRRPSAPGMAKKSKSRRGGSEYGKELKEKQRLKEWYHLRERQFSKYVKNVLSKRGKTEDTAVVLIRLLEKRLDNVVFKLGFASSHAQARQLVSHGHFMVNGKRVNVPSFELKVGDTVSLSPAAVKKVFFKNIEPALKKHKTQTWLDFNKDIFEGKVSAEPTLEEVAPPADITAIFEFYSR